MKFIYHGADGWIKQASRNVQIFRSGLCRIQLEYISRSSSASYSDFKVGDILADEDSTPCIDCAYIFPDPSYSDMGNGFIKCTVTAYGRVNTRGVVDTGRKLGSYITYVSEYYNKWGITVNTPKRIDYEIRDQKLFDFAIYRFVIRQSEFPIPPETPLLYIYDLSGEKIQTEPEVITIETLASGKLIPPVTFSGQLTEISHLGRQAMMYEITNYGFFNEVIISVDATGYLTSETIWNPIQET